VSGNAVETCEAGILWFPRPCQFRATRVAVQARQSRLDALLKVKVCGIHARAIGSRIDWRIREAGQ
jgi:hypothetical protein